MKKLMIVLMAALVLMGTLLVSCNQNVGEDRLSSVTISEDLAKGLTTSLDPNVKPVGQLAWYYKATKDDNGFFVTGQKTEWTLLPTLAQGLVGQSLGQMSYGAWKFEFEGRDYGKPTATAAYTVEYYCDGLYETINKEETALTVPLKQGAAFDKAGIIFKNLIFTLNGVEVNDSVKIPSTETGSTIGQVRLVITETGTENSWAFTGTSYAPATTDPAKPAYIAFTPASSDYFSYDTYSSHTYEFVVKYNDVAIMTPFAYTVYIELGYDMTISGDINAYEQKSDVTIEKTTESWTVQTALTPVSAEPNADLVATTDATPAKLADATSEGQTTVKASTAALATANNHSGLGSLSNSVKVTVSSTETASVTFAATAGTSAFAGIDLKLMKTVTTGSESVTSEVENANFGTNNPVTVETYIAKNLTNVVLTYPANSEAAQPVASTDSTEIAAHKAHEMTAADAADGTKLGYYPATGLLRFTTTHFSEFAVFADQFIFDKTANTAYKLTAAGLLEGADFDDSHEYLLLDPAKANLVSDDIDVFNASKSNWTVLHDSSDVENTTDFAGGYGTKIEPYWISSRSNMLNISNKWEDGCYYKVVEGTTSIDCSNWGNVYLNGNFNGSGVRFENLDRPLFKYVYAIGTNFDTPAPVECFSKIGNFVIDNCNIVLDQSFYVGAVVWWACDSIEFFDIDISGYLQASGIGSFLGQSNGFDWSKKDGDAGILPVNIVFKDCHSSMTLVSSSQAGGFIGNVCWSGNSESYLRSSVRLIDSYYDGQMTYGSSYKPCYIHAHSIYTNTNISFEYSEGKPDYSNLYYNDSTSGANYLYSWVYNGGEAVPVVPIEKPVKGSFVSGTALENAEKVKCLLCVGTNPGNATYNYIVEVIDVKTQKDFATGIIKNFTNVYLAEGPSGTYSIDEITDSLTIYSVDRTQLSGASVRVEQYDANNKLIAVSNISF